MKISSLLDILRDSSVLRSKYYIHSCERTASTLFSDVINTQTVYRMQSLSPITNEIVSCTCDNKGKSFLWSVFHYLKNTFRINSENKLRTWMLFQLLYVSIQQFKRKFQTSFSGSHVWRPPQLYNKVKNSSPLIHVKLIYLKRKKKKNPI